MSKESPTLRKDTKQRKNRSLTPMKTGGNSNNDLLTSMASRLAKVEEQLKREQALSCNKDIEIAQLKQKLAALLGEEADVDVIENTRIATKRVLTVSDFIKRLEELNASTPLQRIEKSDQNASFSAFPKLKISIYSDGFMLGIGPFRSYAEQSSADFFRDVCDGFYPQELKERYKEGIVFEICDCSDISFSASHPTLSHNLFPVQQSQTNKLKSENSITTNEFLTKLPTNTVREGKLIPIRNEIQQLLGAVESRIENIVIQEKIETVEVCKLKIIDAEGNRTFIMSIDACRLFSHVHILLLPFFENIEISFRACLGVALSNEQNLKENRLYPSACLYVQRKHSPLN